MEFFLDIGNQDYLNFILQILLISVFIITLFVSYFIPAHYGKFFDPQKSKITLSNTLGWMIMETPNLIVTTFFFFYHPLMNTNGFFRLMSLLPFFIHYFHRSLIYPFKLENAKKMPLDISLYGCIFCTLNSIIQNRSILYFANYSVKGNPFLDKQLLFGLCIFLLGMYINIKSDYMMLEQKKKTTGYIIPYGFLYNYISSPNYLGEIIEWIGFATAVKTLSSWIFVFTTIVAIFPRAVTSHRWLKEKFGSEFPKERKAIIPYII
jgi:hypothetical protein